MLNFNTLAFPTRHLVNINYRHDDTLGVMFQLNAKNTPLLFFIVFLELSKDLNFIGSPKEPIEN